jgi:hypothetical protein
VAEHWMVRDDLTALRQLETEAVASNERDPTSTLAGHAGRPVVGTYSNSNDRQQLGGTG